MTGTTGLYDGYDGYDGCSLYSSGECISIDLESPLLKLLYTLSSICVPVPVYKVFVKLPVYNVPVYKDFVYKVVTVVLDGCTTGVLRGPSTGGNPTLYLPHFMLFLKIINFFIFHIFYTPLLVVTGTTGLYDGYTGYDGSLSLLPWRIYFY